MQAIVIGTGVGGMVCALRLGAAGFAVTVLEGGERVGGKLNIWEPEVAGVGRFRFDTGPHVLTMPWAIEELFADLGETMGDYLDLVRVDPLCRYHFAEAPFFDAPAESDEAARRVAERFPEDADGFREFLAFSRRIYDVTEEPFLRQDFSAAIKGVPSPAQWKQLADFVSLAPWQTVRERVRKYIKNPRLQEIFDLYAFYNGSSPHKAPGIFAIIAWVQWGMGTFYLRGGLRTYATALEALAQRRGVVVRTGTTVQGVCVDGTPGRGRVTGVQLQNGECLPADVVVCNADPLTAYEKLIPPKFAPPAFDAAGREKLEPSTSAFVLLLGVRGEVAEAFPHLSHFNSFLPADAEAEYQAIFEQGVPAEDPVIGVTCQSVTESDCAPPGFTNLFVMTSPPPLSPRFVWNEENTRGYRDRVLALLETRGQMPGLRERIVCEQIWTPQTFADRYGAFRGSLYGLSSNGLRSAFLRPPNRAKGIAGLYFVGGGTHPGGGLPMVTLGGKIVADAIRADAKK